MTTSYREPPCTVTIEKVTPPKPYAKLSARQRIYVASRIERLVNKKSRDTFIERSEYHCSESSETIIVSDDFGYDSEVVAPFHRWSRSIITPDENECIVTHRAIFTHELHSRKKPIIVYQACQPPKRIWMNPEVLEIVTKMVKGSTIFGSTIFWISENEKHIIIEDYYGAIASYMRIR